MKKQKGQLLIMLLVLVVLGGGYFGLCRYNKIQSEKGAETEEEVLFAVEKDDISRFSYDYNDTVYTYEKNEEDTWFYTDQPDWNLTQYRLTNITSKLAALTVQNTITGVTDLSQYGLDEPAKTVTFETETESYTFHAGDYNDISGVYYICLAGDDSTVYTVSSSYVTVFNLDPEEIIEEEE